MKNIKREKLIGQFGLCVWSIEQGTHLVAPKDIHRFFMTYAIFQCVGIENQWLKIQYKDDAYHVSADIFQPVPKPDFLVGQVVFVPRKECSAEIVSMTWHFKDEKPIYFLSFDGKRSSRRYYADELEG